MRKLALQGGDLRFCAFLDSRVAKGSISKGRSSARALLPSLRKSAAVQVAFGLYPALGFAPTKLNVADDPTRDQPLRKTDSLSLSEKLPTRRLAQIHATGLSAVAARWVRLVLLASMPQISTSCVDQNGSTLFGLPPLSDQRWIFNGIFAVTGFVGFWISFVFLLWILSEASKFARNSLVFPCQLVCPLY